MNNLSEQFQLPENQQSKCYQEIQLAINNFNDHLIKLVDSLNNIDPREFSSLALKLEGVGKNIAFINKYSEVVAKK